MSQIFHAIRQMGILLADPDAAFRDAVYADLKAYGFQRIYAADTATEALTIARDRRGKPDEIKLVLADYCLPDNSSAVIVKTLRRVNDMVVMIDTAFPTEVSKVQSLALGAVSYAAKPCESLLAALQIEQHLTQFFLNSQLKRSTSKSDQMFLEVLAVMARIIEAKDLVVHNHSENVARLAMSIAGQMEIGKKEYRLIGIAGLLHDLGKMAIKDDILHKPGRLDAEEWRQMKKHPLVAATILEPIEELTGAIASIRHHHERYDGSGYPGGLVGENIPIGARVIHVAEAFDMMTTSTPYQEAKVPEIALSEIKQLSGAQFDPATVTAFLRSLDAEEIVDPIDIITLLADEGE